MWQGEFTLGLAREHKDNSFIGVDIKWTRIWKGSTIAIAEGLQNVVFSRSEVELLNNFFDKGEIHELWTTFPDPRPKKTQAKKRLTSPLFLEMYKQLVETGGVIHFKTDNTYLYLYTLERLHDRADVKLLVSTDDFYSSEHEEDHHGIKTRYEKIFSDKGEESRYLKFRFLEEGKS